MNKNIIKLNRSHVYLSYVREQLNKIFWYNNELSNNTGHIVSAFETIYFHLDNALEESLSRISSLAAANSNDSRVDTNKVIVDLMIDLLEDGEMPGLVDDFFTNQRIKTLIQGIKIEDEVSNNVFTKEEA